eukprot:jgi/Bigna1/78821/fgenesh1_pg.57_\
MLPPIHLLLLLLSFQHLLQHSLGRIMFDAIGHGNRYCVNFPAENHEGVMVQAKITSVEPDGTLRIRSHQAGQNNKKLTVRRVVAGLLRRLDFLEQENHTLIQRVKTDQRTIACLEERGGELKEKEEAKFSLMHRGTVNR